MASFPQQHILLPNGAAISYIDEGPKDAPVLLLVHGLGTYAQSWNKNIQALAGPYRCIAIDLPGHGHSAPYKGAYSLRYFADCLLHFIGVMNLRQVTLGGHSMGAQVCITALKIAPDAAEKLLLVAPAGFERFSMTEAMLYNSGLQYASLFGDDSEHIRHLLRNSFTRFPKDAAVMMEELIRLQKAMPAADYRRMTRQCIAAMLEEPVYEYLPKVAQPTLIIFGGRDALIPNQLIHPLSTEKLARHVQKRMQQAKLLMIPGGGHFVQWEFADAVNKAIADFLA